MATEEESRGESNVPETAPSDTAVDKAAKKPRRRQSKMNVPESGIPETAVKKTRRRQIKTDVPEAEPPETAPKKRGRPRRSPGATEAEEQTAEITTVSVVPPEEKKPARKRRAATKKSVEKMADARPEMAAPLDDAAEIPPEEVATEALTVPAVAVEEVEVVVEKVGLEENAAKKRPGRRRRTRKSAAEVTVPEDAPPTSIVEEPPVGVVAPPAEASEGNGWGEGQPEETGDYRDAELLGSLPDDEPEDAPKRVSKLLINAEEPEECRLALLENGRLESIHVSTVNRAQIKSNIYKAKIVAIEPNLQAAFVDYGGGKNGFLPFAEIHPEYYKTNLPENIAKLVKAHQFRKLSINNVLEKGGELLVQVVKEEIGKKGANMTTYLSIPGRSVVLMPGSDSTGISRKIVGESRRSQLRDAMMSLDIPEGIGWIVRTAGSDITKAALARDVEYLLRLWEDIRKKGQEMEGVGQLYEDHLSVPRFLREHFDPSIEEILVDEQFAYDQVLEFVALLPEEQRQVKVRLHKGSRPIFNQFSIEDQIESIYQPKVNLPSGGSIVIDATEALVAIDVNSGSTGKGQNFEETIFQANMEAAAELARQLRLRDLGGLIVVDFIDMRNRRHIRDVEQQVKRAMKRDKARVDISHISKFGLMQISRQKLGAPIETGSYRVCPHCKGRGVVRSVETLALFYLRRIQTGASRKNVLRVDCHFPLDVATYLLNAKRRELADMEERHGVVLAITADPVMKPADYEISFGKEKEENGKKQA